MLTAEAPGSATAGCSHFTLTGGSERTAHFRKTFPCSHPPAVGTDNPGNPGPETALGLVTRVLGRQPGNSWGRAGSSGPQTLLPAHVSILRPRCLRAGLTPQGRRGFPSHGLDVVVVVRGPWVSRGTETRRFSQMPWGPRACVRTLEIPCSGRMQVIGLRRGHCCVWGVSHVSSVPSGQSLSWWQRCSSQGDRLGLQG